MSCDVKPWFSLHPNKQQQGASATKGIYVGFEGTSLSERHRCAHTLVFSTLESIQGLPMFRQVLGHEDMAFDGIPGFIQHKARKAQFRPGWK